MIRTTHMTVPVRAGADEQRLRESASTWRMSYGVQLKNDTLHWTGKGPARTEEDDDRVLCTFRENSNSEWRTLVFDEFHTLQAHVRTALVDALASGGVNIAEDREWPRAPYAAYVGGNEELDPHQYEEFGPLPIGSIKCSDSFRSIKLDDSLCDTIAQLLDLHGSTFGLVKASESGHRYGFQGGAYERTPKHGDHFIVLKNQELRIMFPGNVKKPALAALNRLLDLCRLTIQFT